MIAYAPNISWLLPELQWDARLKAVSEAGFEAVEFGFPGQVDLSSISRAHEEHGVLIALFNEDIPAWGPANRGFLADPRARGDLRRSLDTTFELARSLKALKVMLPVGASLAGVTRQTQIDCVIENLRAAAPMADQADVMLTIEALNQWDYPGYLLTSSKEGFEIIRQVNHPSVRFQFDTYHLQRMEGSIAETLAANLELIGHIQFGDYPGRVQPGFGVLDFAQLDALADGMGYSGYIGLEYVPSLPGVRALDWVPASRRRLLPQHPVGHESQARAS